MRSCLSSKCCFSPQWYTGPVSLTGTSITTCKHMLASLCWVESGSAPPQQPPRSALRTPIFCRPVHGQRGHPGQHSYRAELGWCSPPSRDYQRCVQRQGDPSPQPPWEYLPPRPGGRVWLLEVQEHQPGFASAITDLQQLWLTHHPPTREEWMVGVKSGLASTLRSEVRSVCSSPNLDPGTRLEGCSYLQAWRPARCSQMRVTSRPL